MIPKECRRLAEVDFPVAAVSRYSAREKSVRHGHPSTLALWWARRPLGACRAILLALLWPDPCDPHCPEEFKEGARRHLPSVLGRFGETDGDLRQALLKFIGEFANWDLSENPLYLEISRKLVHAAHGDESPLVVDPFAGGGSIPLEALHLGCDAFASDVNPVACLILKVTLEDIPRYGPALGDELRRVGAEVRQQAEREVAEFYPRDPDDSTPIAYLWARTVRCESPNCGAEIPLVRSFWLCKKANRRRALRYNIVRRNGEPLGVEFDVFEPKSEEDVPSGTVTRGKAICPVCGKVLPRERVRAQLAGQQGGADVIFDRNGKRIGGATLLAVVTVNPGERGRHYRVPNWLDYDSVWKAQQQLERVLYEWESTGRKGLCPVPDEPVDEWHHDVNRMPMYGMSRWGDLFTARQKLALIAFAAAIRSQGASTVSTSSDLVEVVSNAIGKRADYGSSGAKWHLTFEKTTCTFGRQALPLTWDYVEAIPLGETSGAFGAGLNTVYSATDTIAAMAERPGQVQPADACEYPLPDQSCGVWFTDPPYYDAIDYAHCSDFFFVWLKRALPGHPLLCDSFDGHNPLTPKAREIVVDSTTTKGHGARTPEFYEQSMARAFAEGRRVLREDGIGSVVFAHKTTKGWETLLSGLIGAGWTITGSWPIATERPGRLRSQESAALATSVHLICRPRPEDAPVGDWGDVLHELPKRVGDWMERLQREGIRGADLVFACIGPALEIFSRYGRVETVGGREVRLPEYLEKVWEVVGRTALEQVLGTAEARARNGTAGAVEEDARLTALFLWTLQTTDGNSEAGIHDDADEGEAEEDEEDEAASRGRSKGYTLVFDIVRRFAQPLGINLPKWEGRTIETKKGVVRLLPLAERAQQLFGKDGAQAAADRIERNRSADTLQRMLFPDAEQGSVATTRVYRRDRGKKDGIAVAGRTAVANQEVTTLDRVHAAMLLQANGRTDTLRVLLKGEQERGPDFVRLANALSALYPKNSEEKRLLDAMLLAVPR